MTSSRIQGALTLVLILLAAFLFAGTINALKEYRYIGGGVPAHNTVTVTGEGEVFVVPDTAEFTVTIEEEAETAGEVQALVATKMEGVQELLTAEGVVEGNIKTVSYNLQPKYRFEPEVCPQFGRCDRERIQDGFRLTQRVQVKVDDLDAAGRLIASVSELEVMRVSGLTFTVADEEVVKAEARALAIEAAEAKAEVIASDLGVVFTRVVNFREGDVYMPVMRAMSDSAMGLGGAEMELEEAVLPAGENQVTSRVSITYEIR